VSILVDPQTSTSYIGAQGVEKCMLKNGKFKDAWLVQLGTVKKLKVVS